MYYTVSHTCILIFEFLIDTNLAPNSTPIVAM